VLTETGAIRVKMWTVAQTKPGQLDLALTNLARQGYRAFCPVFEKRKLNRHRIRASIRQLRLRCACRGPALGTDELDIRYQ